MKISCKFKEDLLLSEAIDKLRLEADPTGELTSAMSSVAKKAFEQHDAVHIIFNCGTSLRDEIAAHVWMALGTTAKISEMHKAVANQEHRQVLSGIGHFKLIGVWLTSLPRLFGILISTLQMSQKVDFNDIEILKTKSISAIRSEHSIPLRNN